MVFNFLNLRQTIRSMVWPSGEARSRRVAHDKWFVDALIEIQRYVECWQQNNTDLIPHCATLYQCGLTSFDFARSRIKRLSVVNAPTTAVANITQSSVDVFQATESLPSDNWPGYPSTINNGINNGFAPVGVAPNVRYEYGTPTAVTAYVLDVIAGSGVARPSETIPFLLEGSNDSSTWNIVDSQSLTIAANTARQTITVAVSNSTAYARYRLSIGASGENFQLWGIFIYGLSFTGYTGGDLAGDIDWCSEIPYEQVDYCHIANYFKGSARAGCCLPMHLYFGVAPVPTGAGLPAGLPVLPLGYHYPQSSTDSTWRATRGLWAKDSGRIFVVPYIQTTETVVIRWDGIKNGHWDPVKNNVTYDDGDLIEEDPTLIRAVYLYVLAQHEKYDNRDAAQAAVAELDFRSALQDLWKDCHEETMLRNCEGSKARAASPIVSLFYNDARSYTASCPDGQTGEPSAVTIPADTVSSPFNKADANNRAYAQAVEQANAMLSCVDTPVTYYSIATVGHASCPGPLDGNPAAEGEAISYPVPSGFRTSTTNQAAANATAQQAADDLAAAQLVCTFWNKETAVTVSCPAGQVGSDVTTDPPVPAHTYSGPSQAYANALASTEAERLARLELVCDAAPVTVIYNTSQVLGPIPVPCTRIFNTSGTLCTFNVSVTIHVGAGRTTGANQGAANVAAQSLAGQYFNALISSPFFCQQFPQAAGNCIDYERTYSI